MPYCSGPFSTKNHLWGISINYPHFTDEATEDYFYFTQKGRSNSNSDLTPNKACGLNYHMSIFKVMPP